MTVRELIALLQTMPPDAPVHLDEDEYPMIVGAFLDTQEGIPDYFPPASAVLLETRRE
jgi:hypothetical protein